nr:MAG TPA: hypothetical protein [Caudoviricetes sp.]
MQFFVPVTKVHFNTSSAVIISPGTTVMVIIAEE